MKYYKIILNSEIIGVATSNNYFRFQTKHSMLERANEDTVEYIESTKKLYHASWMQPIKTNLYQYELASIIEITEQEYNILAPISEPIPINEEDAPEEPIIEPVDPVEEITVEYVRNAKIAEMSYTCRTTIEAGFDLVLRNESHHFSLDT